jgi:hypothetical protein
MEEAAAASSLEGSCKYIEYTVADSRQGEVLLLRGGLGERLTLLIVKK